MLYSEAVSLYLQSLRARRRSPKTITWYQEQFAAFSAWSAADDLPDAETIDAYLAAQHAAGLRPSTVHARWRSLRALLNFLERRRYLSRDDNPVGLVEPPSVPKERRRYIDAGDFALLLGTIDGDHWLDHRDRLILMLLYYSGLRLAELCALRLSDVYVQRLEILVSHGKGDRARVVPTVAEIGHVLAGYLYTRPQHSEILLLKSDGYDGCAGALQGEGVRQMLIRRCRAAGIAYYSPHCFRHAFAMWTLNAGVRLTTVSEMMGHSDPDITHAIYAHTTTITVRREYDEAIRRLRGTLDDS